MERSKLVCEWTVLMRGLCLLRIAFAARATQGLLCGADLRREAVRVGCKRDLAKNMKGRSWPFALRSSRRDPLAMKSGGQRYGRLTARKQPHIARIEHIQAASAACIRPH